MNKLVEDGAADRNDAESQGYDEKTAFANTVPFSWRPGEPMSPEELVAFERYLKILDDAVAAAKQREVAQKGS